jgi:hypothetical protein
VKCRELIEALVALDADDANVEVLEHDGTWSWVSEASTLVLADTDGPTTTVVLHVANEGVRMGPSLPTVTDWAKQKEKQNDQ